MSCIDGQLAKLQNLVERKRAFARASTDCDEVAESAGESSFFYVRRKAKVRLLDNFDQLKMREHFRAPPAWRFSLVRPLPARQDLFVPAKSGFGIRTWRSEARSRLGNLEGNCAFDGRSAIEAYGRALVFGASVRLVSDFVRLVL